jgi:DNA-binding IclR family transcriptional regulator
MAGAQSKPNTPEGESMSSTFMRGLMLLETIDRYGPLTVTELTRRTGIDKATVSRLVTASTEDGWIARTDRGLVLGPRSALMGRWGVGSDVIAQAEPLVHAIAGITGLMAHAYGLVGSSVVLLASANGREEQQLLGEAVPGLLNVTAAGRAIAAQLTPTQLDSLLPGEPFPDGSEFVESTRRYETTPFITRLLDVPAPVETRGVPTTRRDLDDQLDQIRRAGTAFDPGDLNPNMACIAMPWPHPSMPAALACLGTPTDIAAAEALAVRCMAAASLPAATPRDVITAAAALE